MLGGFSLFTFFPTILRWIFLAISIIALILLIIFRKKTGTFPILSLIFLLIFCGLSVFYFDWYFPISGRITGAREIRGTITSISYQELFGARFTIQTNQIDDIPFSSAKLLVTLDSEEQMDTFSINDEVLVFGEIESLKSAVFGFDEKQYYALQGVQGAIKITNGITFIQNDRFSLVEWVASIRDRVSDYILNSADEQTAGLLAALITGEKSTLPGQLRLDFQRIGLSHVLAVSGMHLAILTTLLHKVLSLLSIDKKWRYGISMLFVVGYMGLTGFSVSVLRAGSMVLIANFLFLLAKTWDSVTNLMISVIAICIISPYAVHDTSLLLSFFATLGVLAAIQFIGKIPYHIAKWKKCLIAILSSLLTSLFAISLTLPFSVFEFERISYIAPITTLIFSFLIEIFIVLGGCFLILGTPDLLLKPLTWLANRIADLAAHFSELPNVYSITEGRLLQIVAMIFYIAVLIFLIFKIQHKKAFIGALLILFVSIFVIGYTDTEKVLENDKILYFSDAETNDVIIAVQNQSVTVANITNNTNYSRGYLLNLIDEENILAVDYFWIPQYTANLPAALSDILSNLPIRHIYLPEPNDEEENALFLSVTNEIEKFRCTYSCFSQESTISIEDMAVYQSYRPPMKEGCRVILSLKFNEKYYTYIAHGAIEEKNTDLANYAMSKSHTIIFGCRGRSYREPYYLEEISTNTKVIIIQTDDIEISEDVYLSSKDQTRFFYKLQSAKISNDE